MSFGAGTDERCCETPCYANKEETKDVVEDWRTRSIFGGGSHGYKVMVVLQALIIDVQGDDG